MQKSQGLKHAAFRCTYKTCSGLARLGVRFIKTEACTAAAEWAGSLVLQARKSCSNRASCLCDYPAQSSSCLATPAVEIVPSMAFQWQVGVIMFDLCSTFLGCTAWLELQPSTVQAKEGTTRILHSDIHLPIKAALQHSTRKYCAVATLRESSATCNTA